MGGWEKDFASLLQAMLIVVWTPSLEPRLERLNLRRLIEIEIEIENNNYLANGGRHSQPDLGGFRERLSGLPFRDRYVPASASKSASPQHPWCLAAYS